MTVKFDLLRNDRVFVGQYEGELTAEDIDIALKALTAVLDGATVPIHNIGDFSKVTKYPSKMLTLARNQRKAVSHPRMGRIIAVTRNTFFTTMLNTILRILPGVNVKLVGTMSEAMAEIDKILAAEAESKTA